MSTTYTLTLNNNYYVGMFYVCTAPPTVDGASQVFINVWFSKAVPKNSSMKIQAMMQFNAYSAPPQSSTAVTGTITSGGASQPVTLGHGDSPGTTYNTVVVGSTGYQNLELRPALAAALPGCFSINNSTGYPPNNNFLLGLSLPNPMNPGQILPVATFQAKSNTINNVAPVVNFYVAAGSAISGQIVDFNMVKAISGLYAFAPCSAGESFYNATITINSQGIFSSATYS